MKKIFAILLVPIFAGAFCILIVLLKMGAVPEEGTVVIPGASFEAETPASPAVEAPVPYTFEPVSAPAVEEKEPAKRGAPEYSIAEKMPRKFQGTFQWDGDEDGASIVLTITGFSVYDEETITFCGTTDYDCGALAVDINGDIDRFTLEIEFSESNPEGDGVVDGVFKGYVSPDLKLISARWVPFAEGEDTGVLTVAAVDEPGTGTPGLPDDVSCNNK